MMTHMAKALDRWKVLPHDPIQKLEENLWYVRGMLGRIQRMMAVTRLGDGRLVIYNAVALDEPEMQELEAWGRPAFLIVPNAGHRNDAKIWKQRYPGLRVIAPAGAKRRVEEVLPVDDTGGDFGDPAVRFVAPDCTAARDCLLEVRSARGVTLVINDLVMNQPHQKGVGGLIFRALGFTGTAPKVAPLSRLMLVRDRAGLKSLLEQLAGTEGLVRVLVSHGQVIDRDPAAALRTAAATA
jgi:hypothetical protein